MAPRPTGTYRMSDRSIRRWTIGCFVGMGVMLAIGIGIGIVSSNLADYDLQDTLIQVGIWTAVGGGLLVPILIAAMVGGLTLARFGWLPGLMLGVGLMLVIVGQFVVGPAMWWVGVASLAVSVALILWMGIRLDGDPTQCTGPAAGTSGSPRLDLNRRNDAASTSASSPECTDTSKHNAARRRRR